MRRFSKGFTLVEMVVIMPIMIVAIAITITFILNVFISLSSKNTVVSQQLSAQSALFTIRDDIMFANFFEGELQPNESDPYAPRGPNTWHAKTDNALMISEIAYTANRQNPDRTVVRVKDAPSPCTTADYTTNIPATNTLIYFVSGGKLYRRTIIPDQTKNCTTTFRIQSCPAANASPTCPADIMLAEDVKTFSITYYSGKTGDADTPVTSSILSDADKYIRITKADIILTLEKVVNGEPVSSTAKLTLKKAE
jgi:type II secretory pathway component PulJ